MPRHLLLAASHTLWSGTNSETPVIIRSSKMVLVIQALREAGGRQDGRSPWLVKPGWESVVNEDSVWLGNRYRDGYMHFFITGDSAPSSRYLEGRYAAVLEI